LQAPKDLRLWDEVPSEVEKLETKLDLALDRDWELFVRHLRPDPWILLRVDRFIDRFGAGGEGPCGSTTAPELSTAQFLGAGLVGLAVAGRRRARALRVWPFLSRL
jgi:hypothetical protein